MSCYDLSDFLGGEGGGRWSESDSGIGENCLRTWTGDITKNFVNYRPYKLGVSVGSLTNVGGAVLGDSLCRQCKDCNLAFPELRWKEQLIERENYLLQAQSKNLHAQLDDSLLRTSELESQVNMLRIELHHKIVENQDLKDKVVRLENALSRKPEAPPPPPPPPPPPKSLFSQIKNPFSKKSKRAQSVPNINALNVKAPLMNLSSDLLDAIKNQTYHLKPVKMIQKKRRQSSPPEDFNIAKILARRIAMGYGNIEEDNKSIKSFDSNNSVRSIIGIKNYESIMSSGSIESTGSIMSSGHVKCTGSAMRSESTKRVVSIRNIVNNSNSSVQNINTGSIKSYGSFKSSGSYKDIAGHKKSGSIRSAGSFGSIHSEQDFPLISTQFYIQAHYV